MFYIGIANVTIEKYVMHHRIVYIICYGGVKRY